MRKTSPKPRSSKRTSFSRTSPRRKPLPPRTERRRRPSRRRRAEAHAAAAAARRRPQRRRPPPETGSGSRPMWHRLLWRGSISRRRTWESRAIQLRTSPPGTERSRPGRRRRRAGEPGEGGAARRRRRPPSAPRPTAAQRLFPQRTSSPLKLSMRRLRPPRRKQASDWEYVPMSKWDDDLPGG